jgi:hypothetical protein
MEEHKRDVHETLARLAERAGQGEFTGVLLVLVKNTALGTIIGTEIVGEIDPARAVLACEMLKRQLCSDLDRRARIDVRERDAISGD